MGLRAGLDKCGKSRLHRDSIPGTVQPVGSRYTDYATRPTIYTSTYSMERVLLEKLTGSAVSQEIPRVLWNPKVH